MPEDQPERRQQRRHNSSTIEIDDASNSHAFAGVLRVTFDLRKSDEGKDQSQHAEATR